MRPLSRFWAGFRRVRIGVLLVVLAAVLFSTYGTRWRLHAWNRPLRIAIYPVTADNTAGVAAWTKALRPDSFDEVSSFLAREGHRHGVTLAELAQVVVMPAFADELPPEPPRGESAWRIALWSFQMRAWNWRMQRKHDLPSADAEIYVLYHQAGEEAQPLDHSLAVEKMRVGVVHAFAGERNASWAKLATAHELLHILGATDKYDLDGTARFPEGFVAPERDPPLPQSQCEVMAGLVPLSPGRARPAHGLGECAVGEVTAGEVGWQK